MARTQATPASISPESPYAVVFKGDGEPRVPEAMLRGMLEYQAAHAFESDDFSLGGTVALLERRMADVLGKEAAIFVPTGTLANHLALRRHCGTKGRAVVQEQSHLFNDTGDSLQRLSGISLVPLAPNRVYFNLDELNEAYQRSLTGRVANPIGAVVVESPVRRQAGQAVPVEEIAAITDFCRRRGIPTHLDGARLFMMSAASGIPPRKYAAMFDSVYVSLYKYFGAPFGAILAGNAVFVDGLFHERRMFGGGLPSAALVAGLALHGMDGFEERFAAAIAKARDLFAALNRLPDVAVEPFQHGSNIFPLALAPSIGQDKLASRLREHSIFIYPEDTFGGRILLHVNTTILRRSNQELAEAFTQSLNLTRAMSA